MGFVEDDSPEDAYFELSFSPNVSLVSRVRRFVSEFYVQVLNDPEITSRLAVATHELLENAVRYSIDGNTSVRIGVRRDGDQLRVRVDTRNRASADHIKHLVDSLEEMNSEPDADVYYQTLMRRTMKRTDGSGLGLGRIRAETDMAVACEVHEDAVHLRAHARFAVPAKQGAE